MPFARIEALIQTALRHSAAGHRLLLACLALSFAGTLTAAFPVTAVVVPATLLAPHRWRAITLACAIGAAFGATTLMTIFHHLGWTQLYERFPDLVSDPAWARVLDWTSRYGVVALFVIAVSPLPQTPALIFLGAAQHDYAGALIAMFAGKLIKYGAFAWTSSHFPEHVGRALARFVGRRKGDPPN